MPLWELDELVTAGQHLYGHTQHAAIKERFERWGGVARFVLEQTSQHDQAKLQIAINTCSQEHLTLMLQDIDSNLDPLSHKLIHMTATDSFSQGRTRFASAFVRSGIIDRFLTSHTRTKRMQLVEIGKSKDLQSYFGNVWEDEVLDLLTKEGLTGYIRNLDSPGDLSQPFQIGPFQKVAKVDKNLSSVKDAEETTLNLSRHSNLPLGDALKQPSQIYQITVAVKHTISVVGYGTTRQALREPPCMLFIVPAIHFLEFQQQADFPGIGPHPELGELAMGELAKGMPQSVFSLDWIPPGEVSKRFAFIVLHVWCLLLDSQ